MNNYNSVDEIISSTNLIEVQNVNSDEGTFEVKGASWFKFKGVKCDKVYFSGNSWFGLGANSEHVLVNRRDARSTYFWYEEGTLYGSYKFMRYKWSGLQHYNASSYTLVYDVVLFSSGDIFVNVTTPSLETNFGYSGVSRLNCSRSIDFGLYGTQNRMFSFYHLDDDGNDFELRYEKVDIPVPYSKKWLIAKSQNGAIENVYCVRDGALFDLGAVELTSQLFIDNGSDNPISSDISKDIQNCTVLFWNDASTDFKKPFFEVKAAQVPKKQTLLSQSYSFDDESIYGISRVQSQSTDNVTYQLSFDEGLTWVIFEEGKWVKVNNTVDDKWMTKYQIENISAESFKEFFENKKIKVSIALDGEVSSLEYVAIKYEN